MTTSKQKFLEQAAAALPGIDLSHVKSRGFGRTEEISKTLVALVASGQKTGTFALQCEFERDPTAEPKLGDLFLVHDFSGEPKLLYRVTAVETVPFTGINHAHVQVEGPNARDVGIWRKIHWPYWSAMLREMGREPSEDMPVVFHRFAVLYPQPGG
jgi:uncharacterized protein YhfF